MTALAVSTSLYERNSFNRRYNNERPYYDENFRPRNFRPQFRDFDGNRPGYRTVETDSNKCFKMCSENLEHRTFWRASESELLGKVQICITFLNIRKINLTVVLS